jgi:hypothetical protein
MRAGIRLKMIDGRYRWAAHAHADPNFSPSTPRYQPTRQTFALGA